MTFKNARNLTFIPWLSLPILIGSYLLLWNRLPPEIGVHFTFSGYAVTSVSRVQSLSFSLLTLLIVLSIFSWRMLTRNDHSARVLVRYYFAIAALTIIFLAILLYNIYRSTP